VKPLSQSEIIEKRYFIACGLELPTCHMFYTKDCRYWNQSANSAAQKNCCCNQL